MNEARIKMVGELKALRKEKGVSLNLMSDFTGIDKSTLSKYETGVKIPKLDTLEIIANALGRKIMVTLYQPLIEVDQD